MKTHGDLSPAAREVERKLRAAIRDLREAHKVALRSSLDAEEREFLGDTMLRIREVLAPVEAAVLTTHNEVKGG